ncbi:MAG: alpha/beta hydrolase [Clostridiales bacterium]|nr:alpha/beta hydrolase [Clostridiales bacterium]MCF8021994.1 alpha/beta hydrolase [Clostridiales bacterium]
MAYLNYDKKSFYYEARYPHNKDPEKTVVFLHGAGGTHQDWRYQVEYFGKKYLSIAIDLPGHGNSQGETKKDISHYTTFLKNFCEHVIGSPIVLVGHSMGGAIALDFAVNYPEDLSGLVLASTGGQLKIAPAITNMFAGGKIFYQLIDYIYNKNTPKDLLIFARDELAKTPPKVFYNDFLACNNFDITDNLKDISTKTLVVYADTDNLVSTEQSKILHQNIPNTQQKVIENSGHMLIVENPEQFNKYLNDFIDLL